jgi:hypothetical protein
MEMQNISATIMAICLGYRFIAEAMCSKIVFIMMVSAFGFASFLFLISSPEAQGLFVFHDHLTKDNREKEEVIRISFL